MVRLLGNLRVSVLLVSVMTSATVLTLNLQLQQSVSAMCFTVGYDSMGGVKFFFFLTALGNDFESKRDYSYLAGLSPLLFMLNPSLYSLLSYSE